jgi:lipid II:glycine glycyltransferase (peptidoglycan interpeptide bridge formation enzyme)
MKLVMDNNKYDDFLKTRFVSGNFLQSSLWQNFLSQQGLLSWRATIVDEDRVLATCLFYEKKLPFDHSYIYAPKGPIISDQISLEKQIEALELILSKARDITISTKKQAEIFFKLEPEKFELILARLKKTKDVQPRDTWVLDLNQDIKNLVANMHPKTRYNIALATKKNVKVRFSTVEKDLKHFFNLNKKTASRNQIVTHSEEYYKKLFQTLISQNSGELAIAEIDDRVVAINILIHFAKATTYLHGASDYDFRQYMAPQLLQWESIKRAKEAGKEIYDFWGIAPADGSKSSWDGFTRFKKSFGGRTIISPGAYDLIYDSTWYNLYNLGAKLKNLIKR